MSKSKVKIIRNDVEVHSEEWHKLRLNSIGASEVGAVLGLSPFTPAAKLFSEKVGIIAPWTSGNIYTYWGLAMEQIIAEGWSYYDGTEDSYVKNSKEGNVIRQCRKINGYYINEDVPQLTATPDRMINKGAFSLIDKSILDTNCPLEIKNINGFELKKWDTGLPVYYLAQVHAQLICTGADYGELCLLEDGKKLHVFPITRSEELVNVVLEKTHDFWFNRVLPAKKLMEQMATANEKEKEEIGKELYALEPEPEASPAYEEFLKERYKTEPKSRDISPEEYTLAIGYDEARKIAKAAEGDMQFAKNKILHSLQEFEEVGDDTVKIVNRPKNEQRKRDYFSITIKK